MAIEKPFGSKSRPRHSLFKQLLHFPGRVEIPAATTRLRPSRPNVAVRVRLVSVRPSRFISNCFERTNGSMDELSDKEKAEETRSARDKERRGYLLTFLPLPFIFWLTISIAKGHT